MVNSIKEFCLDSAKLILFQRDLGSTFARTCVRFACLTAEIEKGNHMKTAMVLFCYLALFTTTASAACLDAAALTKLQEKEVAYLSSKIPPSFKHGLQAGEIQVAVSPAAQADACQATVTITVPAEDIKTATAILDAQPAKRIMLAAQGYALPSQPDNQASFGVDKETLAINQIDYLQTGDLGKLRANIELMYAFITQQRATIQPNQTNAVNWPKPIKDKVVSTCSQAQAMCACLATEYEKVIPSQQMENILSVAENPYAKATGANASFNQLKKQAEHTCNG